MSSDDLGYQPTNSNLAAGEEGLPSTKKSKTRKVLDVAKKPLRKVGRFVGGGKRKSQYQYQYGSIGMGDLIDDDDDDEELLEDQASGVPGIISSARSGVAGSAGSFMERVASYRSPTGELTGNTTPIRRGSLTLRGAAINGGAAAGGPSVLLDGSVAAVVDPRDWVVFRMEGYLRHVMFILLAFVAGSFRAEWRGVIQRILEYVVVSWLTCCILKVMAARAEAHHAVGVASTAGSSSEGIASRMRPRRLRKMLSNKDDESDNGEEPETASAPGLSSQVRPEGEDATLSTAEGRRSLPDASSVAEDTAAASETATNNNNNNINEEGVSGGAELESNGGGAAAGGIGTASDDELAMLLPKTELELQRSIGGPELKHQRRLKKKKAMVAANDAAKMPHSSLNPFYCLDTGTGERVTPNAKQAFVLNNDWFEGTMMVMIRTPDVDDPALPKGNDDNELVSDYMRDKQRRFEFQYQIKLKKVPDGQKIYFSAELEEPVKMGIIQRAFVGAAMAFIKSTNNSFHYSMAGSKEDPDGRWEKPHMSFPVEMSMDRVVVTKPDETPPQLGDVIYEDPESIKNRKKGGLVDWNLEDTYTMALWTAYVDFLEWRVINLPGIRPFELNKVIGPQPIYLTLYLIPKDRAAEKHYRRDITQVVELELCNTTTGLLGAHARKWAARSKESEMCGSRSEVSVNELDEEEEIYDDSEEGEEDEDDDDDVIVDEEEEEEGDGAGHRASAISDDLRDETEYDAADAATAAELGEGMYLRSGDSVVLRESGVDDDATAAPCFVSIGAGFAVLAEGVSSASTIIIQKTRKKGKVSKARNDLIKSGDTVSIKMITKGRNADESEVRYLSIHRGWWLKWVNTPPTKNGAFTIITHETEFSDHDPDELRASETQSAYLTFGGSFWLRHKRWSQYSVAAAAEGSATYGGRVLGLFQPRSGSNQGSEIAYNSDEDDLSLDGAKDTEKDSGKESRKSRKRRWMKMLQLRAYEASQANMASGLAVSKIGSEEQPLDDGSANEQPNIVFSNKDSHLDVPAWVEVMNRTQRVRQLAYAVRVVPSSPTTSTTTSTTATSDDEPASVPETPKSFVRLRTGRDLAQIMRVGLSWRSTAAMPPATRVSRTPVSPQKAISVSSMDGYATPTKGTGSPNAKEIMNLSSMEGSFEEFNYAEEDAGWEDDSSDEDEFEDDGPSVIEYSEATGAPRKKSKRRIVGSTIGALGKVASAGAKVAKKGAKAGAKAGVKAGVGVTKAGVAVTKGSAAAGKKVVVSSVKTSVKLGKGTVSASVAAGKAVIGSTSRSKAPPAKEPKSKAGHSSKRMQRDLHVAVNKTVKWIGPDQSNLFFLAGELAAPEQSYRTVSNVLTRMSSIPTSSPFSAKFNSILATQIVQASDQDSWFLSGGAMQIGVVPDSKAGNLICESLVARCLWESHWREEWCGVYKNTIAFYAPLTKKPCLEISLSDVQSVRLLSDELNPLPGFPILAIETAWQCRYVAFSDEEARETFRSKLDELLPKNSLGERLTKESERELWKARFWQGFQNSVESDAAVGRGKWAEVRSGSKSISRSILNGRRMDFDLDPNFLKESGGLGAFVENLLETSLSFSLSSLEKDPKRLVKFLDAVSHLRLVPIVEIDRSGVDAFCLFVNLYHCLLQHALLLAVNGPLHRRTVGHFMRASCYEIGGDVFSLAEIQGCIIRGNMSRPVSPKPPYVDIPKKSIAYRFYALEYTDPRVNFVLNTADVACPQDIPILRPDTVDDQLSTAAVVFLENQLAVDVIRRCVLLPKVCDVFRNDFDDDASGCLYFCSRYLDQATVNALKKMLREETTLTIKYQTSAEHYHTKLILRKE